MHIVIVTLWYPHKKDPLYGIFIQNQAQKLAERFDVTVVLTRRALIPRTMRYTEGKVNVIEKHYPYLPNTNERRLSSWSRLITDEVKNLHSKNAVDIIHCHDYIALYAGFKIKEKLRLPYVVTIHNTDFINGNIAEWRRPYLERAMTQSAAVISVGDALAVKLNDYVANDKIIRISNMIDVELFSYRRPLDIRPFRFLFVGNYEERKNVMLLLDAFSRMPSYTELTCIGYGELRSRMNSYVDKNDLTERVQVLDPLPNSELPNYYQTHHCYVSISKAETFGITVAEAMSCGMHVLYSNSGGPEYVVGRNGSFLIEELTASSVAQRMSDVVRDYNEVISKSIRKHAVDNFSESVIIDEIGALYNKVIKK